MVISEEPKVFEYLEEYEDNNNEEKLKDQLIALIRTAGTTQFLTFPLDDG